MHTHTYNIAVSRKRRAAVREGFEHAWEAYQLHAFGKDELKPLTSKGADVMGVVGISHDLGCCVQGVGEAKG